jgi:5-(carboxyamino)imidazole ribonucleotide synthase
VFSKKSSLKIGFLGGGQLARMLILEAHPLSLESHVYCLAKSEPAAQVTSHWHSGSLADSEALVKFVKEMDLVTFESEFFPAKLLAEIDHKNPGKIFPRPSIMQIIQNRQSQKDLLLEAKIPTAKYVNVQTTADLDKAWNDLGGSFVLKKCYGGYDGYGTYFARNFSDLGELSSVVANSDTAFIAEKMISFKRELAIIFVRNTRGQIINLPLVESKQTNGRCDYVLGPSKHPQLIKVQKKITGMMKKMDYVGALAFEFFDTGQELLVNEMAPRVHNSGHYSQDALSESQFLLHLKAGLGHSLNKPKLLSKNFVMVNILGGNDQPLKLPENLQGSLHLYGKTENRLNRKMGHLNYIGDSSKKLLQQAFKERKLFQS